MVYPTYYGVCGDVEAIATIAHNYNIPLLVDEAHGAHFTFHSDLPTPALAATADLSVQSIHKVLGAMTQASMLHVQGSLIDIDLVSKSLQLLQSTSPSYLLLASLDAARQQMALHGEQLMSRTLQLADIARKQIINISGLSVLEIPPCPPLIKGGKEASGFVALDQTRLTVTVSGLGLTGFAADEILVEQGVIAELPSLQHLTFIITLGNTEADIEKLVQAFTILAQDYPHKSLTLKKPVCEYIFSKLVYSVQISPHKAFYALKETLPIQKTCDRISAELVCPYPPGIPILMPGEVITSQAIEYLQQIQATGGLISGCADTTLNTLKVVKS